MRVRAHVHELWPEGYAQADVGWRAEIAYQKSSWTYTGVPRKNQM